ncbi:MAG: type I methionyl aminopeptidase [Armatimonadetes bacterium]|jgi:methionyl aminopeptidase|nr:type I methionyl aminopeptidase [Armatimonadota bacterium]
MVIRKTSAQIEKMRAAGAVLARCINEIVQSIEPDKTTTQDIDEISEELIRKYKGIGSFKNYRGYPNTVCVAVNEEVVHGIPGSRVLRTGDVVGIDLGVIIDGWHADSAVTVAVGGQTSPEAAKLLKVTKEALFKGIEQARPGNRLSDIGHAIQSYAERRGYSVVRDLVGHGIGRNLHEEPNVPNYGPPGKGVRLEEGMTLAIEPMVNIGGYEVETLQDNWTVVTKDRSLSAHFEHTVAITKSGPDILTLMPMEET